MYVLSNLVRGYLPHYCTPQCCVWHSFLLCNLVGCLCRFLNRLNRVFRMKEKVGVGACQAVTKRTMSGFKMVATDLDGTFMLDTKSRSLPNYVMHRIQRKNFHLVLTLSFFSFFCLLPLPQHHPGCKSRANGTSQQCESCWTGVCTLSRSLEGRFRAWHRCCGVWCRTCISTLNLISAGTTVRYYTHARARTHAHTVKERACAKRVGCGVERDGIIMCFKIKRSFSPLACMFDRSLLSSHAPHTPSRCLFFFKTKIW